MSPDFVCPTHFAALETSADALECPSGCRFPVRDGVPRFVARDPYAAAFALQWKRYRVTQLDSYSGVPITERRTRHALGEELWASLAGKEVLEAGCGAGRFTEILLARGAHVTSVDLSEAIEANVENFPTSPVHRVAQADILSLPFEAHEFDVVFCLGVVQHTPSPEAAVVSLYNQVRPGGWLVFDNYTPRLSYYTKTSLPLRQVLKRLDPARGLRVTESLVHVLQPLHRASRRHHWQQALLSRVSPVISYYHTHPELPDELQFEWSLLDTHDSLTDFHRHLRYPSQIRRLLISLGARIERCERADYILEARARRPGELSPA